MIWKHYIGKCEFPHCKRAIAEHKQNERKEMWLKMKETERERGKKNKNISCRYGMTGFYECTDISGCTKFNMILNICIQQFNIKNVHAHSQKHWQAQKLEHDKAIEQKQIQPNIVEERNYISNISQCEYVCLCVWVAWMVLTTDCTCEYVIVDGSNDAIASQSHRIDVSRHRICTIYSYTLIRHTHTNTSIWYKRAIKTEGKNCQSIQ